LIAVAGAYLLGVQALAQGRVALVVGNSAYLHSAPLANPVNDATDMAAALKEVGFAVLLGLDLDKRGFDTKMREFGQGLAQADAGLFFYAGHGLQVAGQNFLVPVDAKLESERDLDFESLSLSIVLRQMELQRDGKTNIIFLDACRDNPLARNLARSMGTRSGAVSSGLAQVETGVGTFIAYSTQPGNVALDGRGRNSPFTSALVKRLRDPERNLNAVMIEVRKDVLATTGGRQVPWDHSALTGDFYFNPAVAMQALPKPSPALSGSEVQALRERVLNLEEQLKRKSDPAETVSIVQLAQLKERSHQLDETIKQDLQRIFELQRNIARETTVAGKSAIQSEISKVHLEMARRGQELRDVNAQVARLEADMATKSKDATSR
jgi:uncharacterized caspase-like protein